MSALEGGCVPWRSGRILAETPSPSVRIGCREVLKCRRERPGLSTQSDDTRSTVTDSVGQKDEILSARHAAEGSGIVTRVEVRRRSVADTCSSDGGMSPGARRNHRPGGHRGASTPRSDAERHEPLVKGAALWKA